MLSFLRIALFTLLLMVAGIVAALVWLIETREGSARLWSVIESQFPEIHAEHFSGSLREGIELRDFRLKTASESIACDRVFVAIDFPAILQRKVAVDRIDLGAVRYRELKEEPEETDFVVDLEAIPWFNEIAVGEISIRSFAYENQGWSIQSTRGAVRLHERPARHAWNVEGRLSSDFSIEKIAGAVSLELHGPLTHLEGSAKARSNAGDLDLRIRIADILIRPAFELELTLKKLDANVLFDQDLARHDLHLKAGGNLEAARGDVELLRSAPDPVQPFDRLAFQFSTDRQMLEITELDASIAKKTIVQGKLAIRYSDWFRPSADLAITGLDLRRLGADLPPSNLQGLVTARPARDHAEIRIQVSDRNLGTLNGLVGLTPQSADLKSLRLTSPSGSAEISGRIAFSGDQAFKLSAKAQHLNPQIWIEDLAGDLSFAVDAKGSLEPLTLDARLNFDPDSSLKSAPVRGDLTFTLANTGLGRGAGGVSWGNSRIALQSKGEKLDIRFDRINPGLFVNELDARLSGSTQLTFKPDTIRIELDLSTPEFRYRDFIGKDLSAAAQGDTNRFDDFRIRLRVASIESGPLDARIQGLELSGSPSSHRLTGELIGRNAKAQVAISGAYSAPAYRGTLDSLIVDTARKKQFRLVRAVPFEAGPKQISLGRLVLKPDRSTPGPENFEMELVLDRVRLQLLTRGRLDQFPLEWLPSEYAPHDGAVSANWNLTYGSTRDALAGRLSAVISRLTLPLNNTAAPPLAFENISLALAGIGDGLELDLLVVQNARNRLQSRIRASGLPGLRTLIDQGLRPQAIVLDGQGSLGIDDLSALGRIDPDFAVSSGRMHGQARFSGTLADPRFDGSARLSDFAFSVPDQGLKGTIPVAEAVFDRSNLRLTRLEFNTPASGGTGHATANLSLSPEELGNFSLAFKGSELQIIDQDTFKLIVSPDLTMAGSLDRLELAGNIRVDRGLFTELTSDQGVSLSSDVVMAETEAGPKPPSRDTDAPGIHLDIDIEIPKTFSVKAHGADLVLGGRLNVFQAQAGVPIANGRLDVVDDKFIRNTYTAYGQVLQIKKGTLLFARSPVNDPGLDIIAVRKVRVGEVGVQVTGTASAPEVQLQSDPAMVDSEILSWLVLGRPSSEAGEGFGALLLAASSDLTGSKSLVDRTREWLKLDELALASGEDTTSGIVTLGKRIGENLYLNYQHGILEQGYKIKAIYRLTPVWSLIAESAEESNAVEIEWSKRF